MEIHHKHQTPPQLLSQYLNVQLRFRCSSSLADPKSNPFMVPWTPSRSVDPLPYVCPPFLYPKRVEKHHEHIWQPQFLSQHLIIQLKSELSRRKAPLPLVKLVFETILLTFMIKIGSMILILTTFDLPHHNHIS